MLHLRNLLLYSLSLATVVHSQSTPQPSTEIASDQSFDFQELLNAIPEESIHAALHSVLDAKYQDGVYEHDRSAVEAVRKDDPPTATKVLVGAALDLIKRQNSNTTTTSTSATAVVIPVEVATTDSAGQTTVVTTSAVATASESVAVTVTTTNSRGSTVTSSTTVPAAVVTASDGKVTTSAVPTYNNNPTAKVDVTTTEKNGNTVVLSQVTSGQVVTTKDVKGSTFITTFTPGGGKISSIVLQTTTLPNGQASVITSYADVQQMTETASSSTTTSPPRLQNGAESLRSRGFGAEGIALIGGAFGVALLI